MSRPIRIEVAKADTRADVEAICSLVESRGLRVLDARADLKLGEVWITAEGSEQAWEAAREIFDRV